MCLYLIIGCSTNKILVTPNETTSVFRLGQEVKNAKVFLPVENNKWESAVMTIPFGAWINIDYKGK